MRKMKLIIITIMVAVFAMVVINKTLMCKDRDVYTASRVYGYMSREINQNKVFKDAIALNNNSSSNACVYFVSEVLRKNNLKVSKDTANTAQLIEILKNKGWKKDTNYKNLKQGDIVFTTDGLGDKNGIPSHVYVFMDWVNQGSYDYAYICDNQAKDYKNKIYHIRNIKDIDNVNGISKDAFSFFMKPQ